MALMRLVEQVAELLLQANADVSACAQDNKGNSALHWASSRNSCGAARVLLKYNARVDLENKDGMTPLTIETAGAEVLKILKGEDPGVASDPARPAPIANLPVSTTYEDKPAPATTKSEQDASASSAPAAGAAAPGSTPAGASTGGKGLGGGGKGLASAPGSRPDDSDDDEEEEDSDDDDDDDDDDDKQEGAAAAAAAAASDSEDKLEASEGGEASAAAESAAAPAAADDDDSDSDSDDDD